MLGLCCTHNIGFDFEVYVAFRFNLLFFFTRGRTGVFVCGLLPNSAAMECGKISIGDQIIEVNGVDMRNATVDEAADIMVSLISTPCLTFSTKIAHLSHARIFDN